MKSILKFIKIPRGKGRGNPTRISYPVVEKGTGVRTGATSGRQGVGTHADIPEHAQSTSQASHP